MRTKLGLRLRSEELLCEGIEGALQICEGHVLIDDEALDLMEGRGVGSIHGVRTEYTTWADHTDRKLALLHHTRLHGRRLRTKQDIVSDIEGILLVSRRVALRDVQLLEVVLVVLDLRTLDDLIAHADEDTLDLLEGLRVRMRVTILHLLRRQRHIDRLGRHLRLTCLLLKLRHMLLKLLLDLLAKCIDQLTELRLLLCAQILHGLQQRGDLTLLTKETNTHIIQCIRVLRFADTLLRKLLQLFKL